MLGVILSVVSCWVEIVMWDFESIVIVQNFK